MVECPQVHDAPGTSPDSPDVSVVVPVYNEEASLAELVRRVAAVAEEARWCWELICVLDGCSDGSREVLAAAERPELRVVELTRNVGQHAALYAGLERARGHVVAMLDADLQNPPEELPRLVAAVANGADAASSWRQGRQDVPWRRVVSRSLNVGIGRLAGTRGRDLGCMLRGYRRSVVERFLASGEAPLFLPVQLARHARRTVDIPVAHAPRAHGESRYTPSRLVRLFGQVMRARFAPPRHARATHDAHPDGSDARVLRYVDHAARLDDRPLVDGPS